MACYYKDCARTPVQLHVSNAIVSRNSGVSTDIQSHLQFYYPVVERHFVHSASGILNQIISEPTAILFVIRNYVRLQVITAVKIHIVAFWTDILWSMPGGYQRYGENHASSILLWRRRQQITFIPNGGKHLPECTVLIHKTAVGLHL